MTFLIGVVALIAIIGFGYVDSQALDQGYALPFSWLQMGILALLFGSSVTRAMSAALKGAAEGGQQAPERAKQTPRDVVIRCLLFAGILFCFLFGEEPDAFIALVAGFLLGVLISYTSRLPEISRHNRAIGARAPSLVAGKPTTPARPREEEERANEARPHLRGE